MVCIKRIAAFAATLDIASAKIKGFHVDDEICSGLWINNKTDQLIKCATFFDTLSNLTAAVRPHGLRVVADAGTAWSCDEGVQGCFNVTYQGKTAPVSEHTVDLTDGVVLMDYDVDAMKFFERAKSYLLYADSLGPSGREKIRMGAAVAPWGAKPEEWQTRNETELEELLSTSLPALQQHSSFGGFAIFFYDPLRNTSLAHPCDGCKHQPKDLWYMDHGIIMDQQLWPEWFEWAKSRQVTGLYISPHSDKPLIQVPGVEGSAADEATFCEFAKRCDAEGIQIELLSGGDWATLYDLPFALKCNSNMSTLLV